jgi:N-glycosylase/DNA lyase
MKRLSPNEKSLPAWKAVVSLDSSTNKKYQDAAMWIAKKEKIDPVHFDVIAWRKNTGYL